MDLDSHTFHQLYYYNMFYAYYHKIIQDQLLHKLQLQIKQEDQYAIIRNYFEKKRDKKQFKKMI